MQETEFRLQHPCEIASFSLRHPDLPFAGWCNSRLEILEFNTGEAPYPSALTGTSAGSGGRASGSFAGCRNPGEPSPS
jgi:hypothetical protein